MKTWSDPVIKREFTEIAEQIEKIAARSASMAAPMPRELLVKHGMLQHYLRAACNLAGKKAE
jgi:hypothetical protein